jgi:hypothetical protein
MSRLEISAIGIEYELLGKQSDPAVAILCGLVGPTGRWGSHV